MKGTGVDGGETAVIENSKGLAQPAPPGADKPEGKKNAYKDRGIKEKRRAGQLVQAWCL